MLSANGLDPFSKLQARQLDRCFDSEQTRRVVQDNGPEAPLLHTACRQELFKSTLRSYSELSHLNLVNWRAWTRSVIDAPAFSTLYGSPNPEHVLQQGQPVHLCPPPKDIVPPELVTKVQERAERVAAQLGLSGLACLHGFVNADTGELKVVDVDTSPPLHPGSAIYAQVRLSSSFSTCLA